MLNETPTLAPDGLPYRLLTLRNSAGMVVTVMDWGATLLSARVPMPDGSVRETLSAAPRLSSTSISPPIWARPLVAMLTASRRAVLNSTACSTPCFQARVRTSCTADRTGLINAAGRLFVKTMAKCCSRWIRLMAIRASWEPCRVRALYADRRQPYRHRIPCDGR